MTKAPTPAEMSKEQSDNTNNATKTFDFTSVAFLIPSDLPNRGAADWTVRNSIFVQENDVFAINQTT